MNLKPIDMNLCLCAPRLSKQARCSSYGEVEAAMAQITQINNSTLSALSHISKA